LIGRPVEARRGSCSEASPRRPIREKGFARRYLVVCGTEGTFHIQPLDNPSARVALATARSDYVKGYQDVRFDKYERYVADAADMAKIIHGQKKADFSSEHDLAVPPQGSV